MSSLWLLLLSIFTSAVAMRIAIIGGNLLGCASAFYIRKAFEEERKAHGIDSPGDDENILEHQVPQPNLHNIDSTPTATPKIQKPPSTATQNFQQNQSYLARGGHHSVNDTPVEIFIFERNHRLGGNKFVTTALAGVSVPTGTSADVNVAACPVFAHLLNQVGFAVMRPEKKGYAPMHDRRPSYLACNNDGGRYERPAPRTTGSRAVLDSRTGIYIFDTSPFRLLAVAMRSTVICAFLQTYACTVAALILQFGVLGHLKSASYTVHAFKHGTVLSHLPFIALLSSLVLGFGLIPSHVVLRVLGRLLVHAHVLAKVHLKYGKSIRKARRLAFQVQQHFRRLAELENLPCMAESTANFVVQCGLGDYVTQSSARFFSGLHISSEFVEVCLSPAIAQDSCDSRFGADFQSSALTSLLALSTRVDFPLLRSRCPKLLDSIETEELCHAIARAAKASVSLSSCVISVRAVDSKHSSYEVTITGSGGKSAVLGDFDAVILCAAVDSAPFAVPGLEHRVGEEYILRPVAQIPQTGGRGWENGRGNAAAYMALVKGQLNTEVLRRRSLANVPGHLTVLGSERFSEILAIAPDIYRITCGEEPTIYSDVIRELFVRVEKLARCERIGRRGRNGEQFSLSRLDFDGEQLGLIIARRFINANCVDRLGSHPELDCLFARNIASLLIGRSWT